MARAPEMAGSETTEASVPAEARWPPLIGTIGIIVGVIVFIDHLDDVLMLPQLRSSDWWASMLGEDLAASVVGYLPSTGWIVVSALIGMALGTLLVVGALRLRGARRSGAALCCTWSWLAITWLLVGVSRALWWLSGHADELTEMTTGGWQGAAVIGVLASLILLAAFPVFLLSWFARADIKAQVAGWSV